MAQKLIIDADPGIGDALAITLALLDPEIDVLAITATAGRVSGLAASRNIQSIVELLDPPKWPRLGCADKNPFVGESPSGMGVFDMSCLDGPAGLGDLDFPVADLHRPHESAKLMVELVRNEPNEITLLTLGPLTNVEMACERAPDFLDLLNGIYCLGGSIQAGGDITAAAEFNVFANPIAARTVLRSPATKTLVPLDVSSKAVLTFDQFNRVLPDCQSRAAEAVRQLISYALRAHHEQLGLEGVPLHEIVALAAVMRSQFFKRQTMAIDVETAGNLSRGATIFDRRGVRQWHSNIDVVHHIDPQGVLDYFTELIATIP